jgi:hypothetical protein
MTELAKYPACSIGHDSSTADGEIYDIAILYYMNKTIIIYHVTENP